MTIYFGLALDESSYPQRESTCGGLQYLGPQKFLLLLEAQLGLSRNPANIDYLRIEQFRQALIKFLEQTPEAFFEASFKADPFATATSLLQRRDELLLAQWNFNILPSMPKRLAAMAKIESIIKTDKDLKLAAGFADRIHEILQQLPAKSVPVKELFLAEPRELLPAYFQTILNLLEQNSTKIIAIQPTIEAVDTDLNRFKQLLLTRSTKNKNKLKGDGTLLILRGKRENQLAAYLAAMLRKEQSFKPVCLIPNKSTVLDNALTQEGMPSMGILSASLARPSLQVLKLVPVFLWNPINPYKILEFASLSVKPLHDELAARIAIQMAQSPGIKGEGWYIMLNRFFNELQTRAEKDSKLDDKAVKDQYNFWFERKRYDISKTVPKADVIEIYHYLNQWAFKTYEDSGNKNQSMLVLSSQAQRIKELLEELPETQLTNLQLERVVRTIYEPSPVELHTKAVGCLPHVHHANAFIGDVETLVWWNFIQNERDHFFSKWYKSELAFLEDNRVYLEGPEQQNARLIWLRKRPVLYTQRQLILIIPEKINGSEVHPHTLLGDLEANFSNLDTISIAINKPEEAQRLKDWFILPDWQTLKHRQLGSPKPMLHIKTKAQLDQRAYETLTSLESLFYYPYQWVFKYQIKLQQSSILSVVKDNTLMGNLAHRLFERLLKNEAIYEWDKAQLNQWFDQEAPDLMNREGATLMLYGREPERIGFLRRVKFAAWSIINLIRNNNWKIEATEQSIKGDFLNVPINARADLVLKRGAERAVIDLKWRGARRRERIIRNEEDLQLVLYSNLLAEGQDWAHTAYFIMENGKMIARNNLAFKEIIAVNPEAQHQEINQRILQTMEATYKWRIGQLQKGLVEIRCAQTQLDLEDLYDAELLDILEMKSGDAPFDDYRTLINLIS